VLNNDDTMVRALKKRIKKKVLTYGIVHKSDIMASTRTRVSFEVGMFQLGGHAIYLNAKKFLPHVPVEQYPGQSLVVELYRAGGIRTVEIGSVMFGRHDASGKLIPARMELVRLAIPRRVYTQSHIDYVIEVTVECFQRRDGLGGYRIVEEPPMLRHFTAKFAPL